MKEAEDKILAAMYAVENLGCSPDLTEVMILLSEAKELLAKPDKKDCPDVRHEVKQGELKCANCGTPYLHGQK